MVLDSPPSRHTCWKAAVVTTPEANESTTEATGPTTEATETTPDAAAAPAAAKSTAAAESAKTAGETAKAGKTSKAGKATETTVTQCSVTFLLDDVFHAESEIGQTIFPRVSR